MENRPKVGVAVFVLKDNRVLMHKRKNIKFKTITNDIFSYENTHYITVFMSAEYDSGEVSVMEPEKCECWEWFEWKNLPRPLFLPIENLLKQGYNPFN